MARQIGTSVHAFGKYGIKLIVLTPNFTKKCPIHRIYRPSLPLYKLYLLHHPTFPREVTRGVFLLWFQPVSEGTKNRASRQRNLMATTNALPPSLFHQFVCSPLCPHRGQTKPSGQRQAAKYCWHASSVANLA